MRGMKRAAKRMAKPAIRKTRTMRDQVRKIGNRQGMRRPGKPRMPKRPMRPGVRRRPL